MRVSRYWRGTFLAWALASLLWSCGGGGDAPEATKTPIASTVSGIRPGVSPFIAFVDIKVEDVDRLSSVRYRITPKPGSASRPVSVSYDASYLRGRSYVVDRNPIVTVPIFGLYAGYSNRVDLEFNHDGRAVETLVADIVTAPYVDAGAVYDHLAIRQAREPGQALGFDFFYMKSGLGSPVVVDSDGEVRWYVPGTPTSNSSMLLNDGFVIGRTGAPVMTRVGFDGSVRELPLALAEVANFHHAIHKGKSGVLAEVDIRVGSVIDLETNLLEVDPNTGAIIKRWDVGKILADHMQAGGDDPLRFVRLGVDWFHMNSAIYDPRTDSLIISGREDFVIAIDYDSGRILWILGDPTKYWHTFPTLAAKSMTVGSGFYPIGQHALSITHAGDLMLFNNGQASSNQPSGTPVGEQRNYSAVSIYSIDAVAMAATEIWRFDREQGVFSAFCSSAYQASVDGSTLISYSVADNGAHVRLMALDANRSLVFEFEYPTVGCSTSWNAEPIAFDAMHIR